MQGNEARGMKYDQNHVLWGQNRGSIGVWWTLLILLFILRLSILLNKNILCNIKNLEVISNMFFNFHYEIVTNRHDL